MGTSSQTPIPLHESPQARPANWQQRTNYMAAMSALEQMLAVSPVLPYSAVVKVPSFAQDRPSLALHLDSVEDVEAFGRFFDAYVTSAPENGAGQVRTTAEGEFLHVPFEAWFLSAPVAEAAA